MSDDEKVLSVDVVAARPVSPSLVRVELGGPELATFTSLGASDEACVMHLPLADGGVDEQGRWYTVRAVEDAPSGRRVIVEIVTHEGGIGAAWAQRTVAGDRVRISTRRSWFRRPADAQWQVLFGDIAGLPAISRIVDEAPVGMRTAAVVEIPDRSDARDLPGAEVSWVHNASLAAGSRLAELVHGTELPDGPGYVYVAGEAAATRGVRKYLRHELGLSPRRYGVVGYWRIDAERWLRRYESAAGQYERIWQHAESTGRDDEEIRDIYEAELAAAGLAL